MTDRLLGIEWAYLSLIKEHSEVSKENPADETKAIKDKVNSYSLDELKKAAVFLAAFFSSS
jgi:hypothetical protein